MSRSVIFQFLAFFLYLFLQVTLLRNFVLFNTAFCFLYVAYILLLPAETNTIALMLLGFLMGFFIDVFYDSLGIHTSTLVLVSFLRNFWLASITPQGGYDAGTAPSMAANGLQWFLVYSMPLIFVHQFALFFVEAGGFSIFWFTMLKVIASLVFTMIVLVLLQYLSADRRRS